MYLNELSVYTTNEKTIHTYVKTIFFYIISGTNTNVLVPKKGVIYDRRVLDLLYQTKRGNIMENSLKGLKGKKKKLKMVGYVRVSTPNQSINGVSVANQNSMITDYCKRNKVDLVEMVEDLGKSGRTIKREGYKKLLQYIQSGDIDGVVVYSISRIGRSIIETSQFIKLMIQMKVVLYGVNENYDIYSPNGRFLVGIHSLLSENESDQMSQRIKDALQYKKSLNKVYNCNPMYGWKKKGEDLVIDDEELWNIRRIKNLRSRGHSFYKIAKKFEAEEVPTKNGGQWYSKSIKNIYGYYYGMS